MSEYAMSDETRAYLVAVLTASVGNVARFASSVCPECGDIPMDERAETSVSGVTLVDDHLMIGNMVVVGCEGYWIIDPNAVGIENSRWESALFE